MSHQDYAPCATRYAGTCSGYLEDHYVMVRAEAECLTTKVPGTVALNLSFNGELEDNTLLNNAYHPAGYSNVDTECYVFTDMVEAFELYQFLTALRHRGVSVSICTGVNPMLIFGPLLQMIRGLRPNK